MDIKFQNNRKGGIIYPRSHYFYIYRAAYINYISFNYSALSESAGLSEAALHDWMEMVSHAINIAMLAVRAKYLACI